ncbi:hypothetical protein FDI85_gp068 [Erwinia phage Machina]|uniref:Lipoprotein n=2 Tax=Machinavirus machina TaxID=2169990 RepID=A0A1B2IDG8_9CAUD|nr:hypothetical protein BIZ81_gp067 [Erwinia phage vB_EamM_Huxley]YP_009617133.1 hypothetical protein FDI85_gp068 [Erwinia phage Machina]ANZ49298.1 hypothetical protein HUXLEY_216 [Erwinia phage vB_EamM_Huxley]ANZ49854.1 hypothetical protein MACHINA_216 [Erwinia phage Machina]ANZ50126.1 hypothetical protein PARSHIK_217 [Erwinia phage vB_EamM_Parshik]
MRVMLICLSLLLTACSSWAPVKTTTANTEWSVRELGPPPVYPQGVVNLDDPRYRSWVADVNAYAYYVFVYARNLNDYARVHGWRPPQVAPICEKFDLWVVHPIPQRITLDERARRPEDISRDLATQLKRILLNYREDRKSFQKAYEAHLSTCLN